MSNTTKIDILLPVMRVVQGSLYKAQDKDGDGKPLVVKSGPNQGKPTVKYFFSGAIEKLPGHTHWAQTEWGAKLWALGHSSWPAGQAKAPTFAWKVEDGDSQIPNKKGKKNCDREGFKGCWIVNLSSGFPPRIYNSNGTQVLDTPDYVKLGYYVQVQATADSNRSDMNPGIYLNHSLVAFQGFGPEIHVGPDAAAVAWGGAAPTGMSATPVGGMSAPAPAPAPAAPLPGVAAPVPGIPAPGPAVPAPAAAAPAPVAVVPQPAMIAPPAALLPPAAPVGPTVKLPGVTWEALVAAGWTEATARAAGHIA
jgi:hypothetical protein